MLAMVRAVLDDYTKNQVAELISDIGNHGMISARTLSLVDTAGLVASTVRLCDVTVRGHLLCGGNGCPVVAVWAAPGRIVDVVFCDAAHVWVRHIHDGEQQCEQLALDAPLIAQWVVQCLTIENNSTTEVHV